MDPADTKKQDEIINLYRADHERRLNSPLAWNAASDQLLAGARILHREFLAKGLPFLKGDGPESVPDVHEAFMLPTIFLLYGFALENLLKAEWVHAQGNNMNEKRWRQFFKSTSNGHSFNKIANLAGIAISQSEAALLDKLEIQVRSTARYPADKTADPHLPDFSKPGWGMVYGYASGDLDVIESLIKRLPREYLEKLGL